MALILECIISAGTPELSYLVGDDVRGVAAVFDPRADVDCYLDLARERQLSITHIFETRVHADHASGARELCDRVGEAEILVSHEGGATHGFDRERPKDGDTFELGALLITVCRTPVHAAKRFAFLFAHKDRPDSSWGVLTGDSLFVDSAGRPELPGSGRAETPDGPGLHSIQGDWLKPADGVIVGPAARRPLPCGACNGVRPNGTIGYGRRFNAFRRFHDGRSPVG